MSATKVSKNQNVNLKKPDTSITIAGRKFTFTQEEKICGILLVAVILLVALIRSKFLLIPFERDEGGYSYYGKMLLAGKVPYKDFYEQKLPGIFYFYAAIIAIFGSSVSDLHTGFIVVNIITILALYFSAKMLFSPITGLITAVTFAIVSITPSLSGFTVQSEHGLALFASIGLLFYVLSRNNNKWYWYLLMGLALGTGFMVKTTGLFMMFWGGLILILDFLTSKEKVFKLLFKQVFFYVFGAAIVIGLLILSVYVRGSYNEFVFWVFSINKYYANRITFEEGMKYFGYSRDAIVANYKFFWMQSIAAFFLLFLRSIDLRTKLFILSIGFFSFVAIVPGYYFYGHYWIQILPGMAILSGFTYYAVTKTLKDRFKLTSPTIKYSYLAIFGILVLTHLNKNRSYYFNPNYELIMRQVYGNNPFPESMEIANYLNKLLKPGDQIAVVGSEPEIYIYTNTQAPTQHVFFSTIVAGIPEHKKLQREFSSEIEKAKPKYFLFYRHNVSLLVQANVDQYVFEWANKYLTENYRVIGVVDMPDGQLRSTYAFGEEAQTFQPKGQNVIYVFERNATK